MKKLLCFLLTASLLLGILPFTGKIAIAADVSYDWGNVPVGAGGFVTGIVIHPTEPNLVYCRTDVGGSYRWNNSDRTWIPLNDTFGTAYAGHFGVDGIALDPQNPEVVYIVTGNGSGKMFKSTNRGVSWTELPLPSANFMGNGPDRSMGECVMVDPTNSNVILVGTNTTGLYRSTNAGASWTQVRTSAQIGAAAVSALGFANCTNVIIRSIVFDPTNHNTVYAGFFGSVSGSTRGGLLKSTDNGATWSVVSTTGGPEVITRMEVRKDGVLFAASITGVYKYTGTAWTNLSIPTSLPAGRYNSISIDPNNSNVMIVVGDQTKGNTMNIPIRRTTNGGTSWTEMTTSSKRINTLPWARNSSGFDNNGMTSSNTADLKIDPHYPDNAASPSYSKRVWLSDWHGVNMTDDITATNKTWDYTYRGMEEVVPRAFITPATGPYRLLAAIADVDGMVYSDYKQYPQRQLSQDRQVGTEAWLMTPVSIDYCVSDPNIVVRAGIDWNSSPKAEFSLNGTASWKNITFKKASNPSSSYSVASLGHIAVSATKNEATGFPSVVVIPVNGVPLVSLDMCQTWQEVSGITDTTICTDYWNKGVHLAADKVADGTFYIQDRKQPIAPATSRVYVSRDWGVTWEQGAALTGLTSNVNWDVDKTFIKANPYKAGEVWSSTVGGRLYRSTDYGKTFTQITTITTTASGPYDTVIEAFGFGKSSPSHSSPIATLFLYGKVGGVKALYRSIDNGATWDKINNTSTPLACSPQQLEGDMRTFGVVYLGLGGRGIWYGQPAGHDSTTGVQEYVNGFATSDPLTGWKFYLNNTEGAIGYTCTELIPANAFVNTWSTSSGLRNSIYMDKTWSGKYTYDIGIASDGGSDGNRVKLYLNFVDGNNYYAVVFPCGSAGKPFLEKVVNGISTEIARCKETFVLPNAAANSLKVKITYVDGTITVQAVRGLKLETLMRATDTTFTSGKLGFASLNTRAWFSYPNMVQNDYIVTPSDEILGGADPTPSSTPSPTEIPVPTATPAPTPQPTAKPTEELHYVETFNAPKTTDWNLSGLASPMLLNPTTFKGLKGDYTAPHLALLTKVQPVWGNYAFSSDWMYAYAGNISNASRFVFNYKVDGSNKNYYFVEFQGGNASKNPVVVLGKFANGVDNIKIAETPVFQTILTGTEKHRTNIVCENDGSMTVEIEHANGQIVKLFDRVKDTITTANSKTVPIWQGGQIGFYTNYNETLFNNVRLDQAPVVALNCRVVDVTSGQATFQSEVYKINEVSDVKAYVVVRDQNNLAYSVTAPTPTMDGNRLSYSSPIYIPTTGTYTVTCYYWNGDILEPLTLPHTAK